MTRFDLRPAQPEDLPAVLTLLQSAALPTEGVADHFAHFIVAWDRSGLAGLAGLEPYGPAVLLRSLVVRPDLRGRGLGAALTLRLLEQARRADAKRVFLLTETAQNFFPRFGFETVARDSADEAVQASVEFRAACPQSAVCLRLDLGP